MKRYDLCTAIIDRVLPAFIALALLTTCRNGGEPRPNRGSPEPYRNPIDAGIHKRKRPDDREREFFGYGRKGASQYL